MEDLIRRKDLESKEEKQETLTSLAVQLGEILLSQEGTINAIHNILTGEQAIEKEPVKYDTQSEPSPVNKSLISRYKGLVSTSEEIYKSLCEIKELLK